VLNSLGLFALIGAANGHNPDLWNGFAEAFGVPSGPSIPNEIAAMRGSWSDQLAWRWQHLEGPFAFLQVVGPETLSAMLLGMAAYRSGFLTGEWSGSHYRRCALIGLGVALPAYLLLGIATMAHGFDQRWVYFGSIVGSVPFRLLGVVGYAAAIILLLRPASALSKRLSAVGRAAFTNYLGTSVLVTGIFYGWGLGLYATLSRAQIYLVPPVVWLLMLAWSKPWLDRFRYGPFEWVWRSAARGKLQPMRKQSSAPALAR
jgi:uncharacterized protein